MNERKTEQYVRDMLVKLGYLKDDFIIEEQQSDNPAINKLLKNASKKGNANGKPEFIIHSKTNQNLLIVIECKADIKKHKSSTLDNYGEYAVDGALLYASFLAKEFDVIAIGISGEKSNEIRITHYLYPKNASSYKEYFSDKLLKYEDYYDGFYKSDIKFNQDYNSLLEYTRELNELLHNKKVKESQRSILISGILIALQNNAFVSAYKSHKTSKQTAKFLVQTIEDEFTNSKIPQDKIQNLKQAFSFITTHTTLNSDKEFLENLIQKIDEKINRFIRTYKYYDTLGQFYIEFLRYANNDKGLGIVLTPLHITELFTELADVSSSSIVYDNCCGTSGFLISSMRKMIEDANNDSEKIKSIKAKQLIGVEYQDDIFALGISNMIIHNDGKTNIFLGDCFNLLSLIKTKFSPSVGMLNPPYKTKKGDIEEFDFILNNLDALEIGGTCVSIVPLSCAIALSGAAYERKKILLEKHTLEAVMSMPEDLFHNSKVNVVTCIMVFTAHKKHSKGKKTWLGYWRDDGFVKLKTLGRIDRNNTWASIKSTWINNFRNRTVDNKLSMMVELTADHEWCAEAFLKTDYSVITKSTYKEFVQKYLAFRLLNNLLDFKKEKIVQTVTKYSEKLVPLSSVFNVKNGIAKSSVAVKDEQEDECDIRFIRPSQTYGGSIDGFVDKSSVDDKNIYPENTIYVSTDGQGSHTFSYLSSFEFIPNSNVSVLEPIDKGMTLNEKMYYAVCVTINRYKFSYGRKPKGDRLKDLLIPKYCPSFVYEDIFSEIIDTWKKIIK
jgi:hypothetical protein